MGTNSFGGRIDLEPTRAVIERMTELAFTWLLARPAVASVIAGATRPDQVDENVAAGQWKLTSAEVEAVAGLDQSA